MSRRNRRRYNNMLILLVAGLGILLLATGRLTGPARNSVPLLPEKAGLEALVFADLVIRNDQGQLKSAPRVPEAELQQLVSAWRQARLVPTLEPHPLPPAPTQVDVYLDDGSFPQTALFYPHISAVKMLDQPQWWRLVNVDMSTLLPKQES